MTTPTIEPHEVADPAHAAALIAEHKQRFPPIPPEQRVYRPSGAIAPGGFGTLVRKGLRGLLEVLGIGVVLVVVLAVIGLGATDRLLLRFLWPACFGLIVFGVLAYVDDFVQRAATEAHCRSPRLAQRVSMALVVTGAVAMAALLAGARWVWPQIGETFLVFHFSWMGLAGALGGVALALWATTFVGQKKTPRYCEACQQWMVELSPARGGSSRGRLP